MRISLLTLLSQEPKKVPLLRQIRTPPLLQRTVNAEVKEEVIIQDDGTEVVNVYVDLDAPRRETSNHTVRRNIYSNTYDNFGDSIPWVLHYESMGDMMKSIVAEDHFKSPYALYWETCSEFSGMAAQLFYILLKMAKLVFYATGEMSDMDSEARTATAAAFLDQNLSPSETS